MKSFFLLFFIILLNSHSQIKAEDIRDFEIEGITIGDSLLNYYDKIYIDDLNKTFYPASDKFYQIEIRTKKNDYDSLSFSLKKNDNNYIIYEFGMTKFFDNNLKACKKFMNSKITEIKSITENLKKNEYEFRYPIDDKKSIAYITDFILEKDSSIRAYCVNWSEVAEKERNWEDNFSLTLSSSEYASWLNNKAYN
jgi:hypothetical protein